MGGGWGGGWNRGYGGKNTWKLSKKIKINFFPLFKAAGETVVGAADGETADGAAAGEIVAGVADGDAVEWTCWKPNEDVAIGFGTIWLGHLFLKTFLLQ
jgi:hypothetical protein